MGNGKITGIFPYIGYWILDNEMSIWGNSVWFTLRLVIVCWWAFLTFGVTVYFWHPVCENHFERGDGLVRWTLTPSRTTTQPFWGKNVNCGRRAPRLLHPTQRSSRSRATRWSNIHSTGGLWGSVGNDWANHPSCRRRSGPGHNIQSAERSLLSSAGFRRTDQWHHVSVCGQRPTFRPEYFRFGVHHISLQGHRRAFIRSRYLWTGLPPDLARQRDLS